MTDPTLSPIALLSSAIRRERERAGLSVTELAKRASVAKSTLSQLESGTGNPSLETLWALALALDVPVSRLISQPSQHVQVIRANEGAAAESEQANYAATLLAANRGVWLRQQAADARPLPAALSAMHERLLEDFPPLLEDRGLEGELRLCLRRIAAQHWSLFDA